MEHLIVLLWHLLVVVVILAIVFAILKALLDFFLPAPSPTRNLIVVILKCIVALILLSWIIGEIGVWGTWGVGYGKHWF